MEYEYKFVQVDEWRITELLADGWEPIPNVPPVHRQQIAYVGSKTYIFLRRALQ